MSQSEIEAKLEVPAPEELDRAPAVLAELGYPVSDGEHLLVADHYLDTLDLDLYLSGWALRLRDLGGRRLLTLKACSEVGGDGLAVREEREEEVGWQPGDGWTFAPATLGGAVQEFALGKELTKLFEVRQERRIHDLSDGHQLRVELSCDRVQWIRSHGASTACLVELELKQGEPDGLRTMLRRLREQTGWQPSTTSKFEGGMVSGSFVK